jgi:hypothetical protein
MTASPTRDSGGVARIPSWMGTVVSPGRDGIRSGNVDRWRDRRLNCLSRLTKAAPGPRWSAATSVLPHASRVGAQSCRLVPHR